MHLLVLNLLTTDFCKQAPAKDCYCKPLLRKLVNKLKATEMEMRLQIHTVQEEMNSRLGKVELKNKQQVCLHFTNFTQILFCDDLCGKIMRKNILKGKVAENFSLVS